MTLAALVSPLDHEPPPADIAGPHGVLWLGPDGWMAGRGIATTVEVPGDAKPDEAADLVLEVLRSIAPDDPSRVRAFAAVPFTPGEPFRIIVPELLAVHEQRGERWVVQVSDGSDGELPLVAPDAAPPAPWGGAGPAVAEPTVSAASWCDAVVEARRRIRAGEATKVVLSREVMVTLPHPIRGDALALRLHQRFPSCTTFSIDGLVGASPELLVSRRAEMVHSYPLAGTAPRDPDHAADARLASDLLSSDKDRWEHQITIDRVHETLLPFCSYLDAEAQPGVVAVANVQHLGTMVEGRLSDPAPSSLELALRLHPTPAVGGEPRDEALRIIAELESGDRGRWAGAVGWIDGAGDGAWRVAIRSAQIDGERASVWAGTGIVADSDPDAELEESRNKLDAILPHLIRP